MSKPFLYILLRGIPDNVHLKKFYGHSEQQLKVLAETLAANPCWEDMQDATFIVRLHSSPLLGLMGNFDDRQQASIKTLPAQLNQTLSRLRYVDYQQAEQDCERLASRLIQEIGLSKIKDCRFTAIPRGGLIVLGMLAYALNLSPKQLCPATNTPLVVVDDCALSGLRFGQFLTSCPNKEIYFATLYSHPSLRKAVTAKQHQVQTCISAWDLTDYARTYHQEDYEAWRTRWYKRAEQDIYWVGMPEHICFAWNEPDTAIWNPVAGVQEYGCKVVPRDFCLKNRMSMPRMTARILYQQPSKGELRPGSDVLFGDMGRYIVVADIQSGANLILDEVAADMWRAIINTSDLEQAAGQLLDIYQVDPKTLKSDLNHFAARMQEQGILVK